MTPDFVGLLLIALPPLKWSFQKANPFKVFRLVDSKVLENKSKIKMGLQRAEKSYLLHELGVKLPNKVQYEQQQDRIA